MSTGISFFVSGEPKAQPRARSFVLRGRGGKPILTKDGQPIIRVHDPGTAEGWKAAIAQAAKEFVPMPPLQGPLRMDIEFRFTRPKDHYKSQSVAARLANAPNILKPSAPAWHIKKPDRDNCEKAVTDALKTIGMFCDDCQICEGQISKVYVPHRILTHLTPGAYITITPLEQPHTCAKAGLNSNASRTIHQGAEQAELTVGEAIEAEDDVPF